MGNFAKETPTFIDMKPAVPGPNSILNFHFDLFKFKNVFNLFIGLPPQ
jgi:hypothetical protein